MRAFTVMRGTMTLCERLPDKEENAMVATPKIATRHPATKMSNSLYTPEEYFERDECSEERLEYVNGEIIAMAGTSLEHNDVAGNIYFGIKTQFRGRPCKVYIESVRVRVSDTRYRYPDVVALCGEAQLLNSNPKTLTNPVAIFEVLSSSTQHKDTGEKFDEYAQNDTLTDYVLVAQDTMRVRHYRRLNEKDWRISSYTLAEEIVRLESLDVSLTLADIYNEITFPKPRVLTKAQAKRQTLRKRQ